MEKNKDTVFKIKHEYLNSSVPWYLGYSGGKDSSALLKLVFIALKELEYPIKPITVIYCDTGVEIPVIRSLAIATLEGLIREAKSLALPINIKITKPLIKNRFFVKVIGRGYPTPTNKFRWCTRRLRISPVKNSLVNNHHEKALVLLGTRKGESTERDKTIANHSTDNPYYYHQTDNNNVLIYSPIINYGIEDVWATLIDDPDPGWLDVKSLFNLYKMANGECPIIRDPKSPPCGKGRFGCWTCTVVRQDKTTQGLIREGYDELIPLYEFRNWLLQIREDPNYRCKKRRNGQPGPGPFTIGARKEMLSNLLHTQMTSGIKLIDCEELKEITRLWEQDLISSSYQE